jgi:SAM-dependent methyltransferase
MRSVPPPPSEGAGVVEAQGFTIPVPDLPGLTASTSEPSPFLPVVPAAIKPPTTVPQLSDEDDDLVPLAAMPIITVFEGDAEGETLPLEPAPAAPPPPPVVIPPPFGLPSGIDVGTDPGWTPAPAIALSISLPKPGPSLPVLPSSEIEDIADDIADDDVAPESDNPPPRTPMASVPPRPPPPPGGTPAPLRVKAPPPTEEVEVDVTDELAPASLPQEALVARPPPPPPVLPPPPPAAALGVAPASAPASAPAPVSNPPPPPPPPRGAEARPSPKTPVDKKRGRPWWEEMFDDDFLRSIKQPTAKQIEAEVAFIDDRLGLRQDALILDLACGDGRHSIGLTRRGYKVIGFDLSLAMMARAQEEAEAARQKINFLHGDMKEMNFENQFDGVYFWGMSFGYFDEEKNFAVVQRIHRALRPGGVLLLDVCNRDFIAPRQPNMVWFEGDGCICMDESLLDSLTSRLKVKRTLMLEDGRTRELDFSIRLYGLHELGKVLHDAGFKVLEVSGQIETPGVFFGSESPRCIVLAERS